MKLLDIIEYITYSELGNLFISGTEEGKIRPKDYPKVIANINTALIALHKRFPILVKLVTVQQYEHIANYVLTREFAMSNTQSTQPYKYIMDTTQEPFNEDILKIERVHTEICGEYPLNVDGDCQSLFTPSYNVLQIPFPLDENAVFIEYRAYPKKIPLDTTDLSAVEVEFPEILIEPLLSYMNYKLYTATGTEKPEAITHIQRYETECLKIDQLGVYNRDSTLNMKLESRGWV